MAQELTLLTAVVYLGPVLSCFALGLLRTPPKHERVGKDMPTLRKVVILVNMLLLLPIFLVALRPTYYFMAELGSHERMERTGSFFIFVVIPVVLAVIAALGLGRGLLYGCSPRWRDATGVLVLLILFISFYEFTRGAINGEFVDRYKTYALSGPWNLGIVDEFTGRGIAEKTHMCVKDTVVETYELQVFDRLPDWDFPIRCWMMLMLFFFWVLASGRQAVPHLGQPESVAGDGD